MGRCEGRVGEDGGVFGNRPLAWAHGGRAFASGWGRLGDGQGQRRWVTTMGLVSDRDGT